MFQNFLLNGLLHVIKNLFYYKFYFFLGGWLICSRFHYQMSPPSQTRSQVNSKGPSVRLHPVSKTISISPTGKFPSQGRMTQVVLTDTRDM